MTVFPNYVSWLSSTFKLKRLVDQSLRGFPLVFFEGFADAIFILKCNYGSSRDRYIVHMLLNVGVDLLVNFFEF